MGKVTISALFSDKESKITQPLWEKVVHTPIVPRKMVEMIIERCESLANHYSGIDNFDYCAGENSAFDQIINYAYSLLDQFEGEE